MNPTSRPPKTVAQWKALIAACKELREGRYPGSAITCPCYHPHGECITCDCPLLAIGPTPHCPAHPNVALICPACHGGKGGKVISEKKRAASKANGKKGGRPKKPALESTAHHRKGE